MYRFACKDLGVDCGFVASAPCPEELKGTVMAHAAVAHADILSSMSEQQKAELTRSVEATIQASATGEQQALAN